MIRVLLTGGPASLRDVQHDVADPGAVVKIRVGNGYEHFSPNGELCTVDDLRLPVFAWCGRTKMAE